MPQPTAAHALAASNRRSISKQRGLLHKPKPTHYPELFTPPLGTPIAGFSTTKTTF